MLIKSLLFPPPVWSTVNSVIISSAQGRHGSGILGIYKCHFLWDMHLIMLCLTKWKCSICISDYMQTTFIYLGWFLKKLADDQCSSITKGSIYHMKPMYIQSFSMEMDWSEILCLMEVYTMFYVCIYCVFTWYSSGNEWETYRYVSFGYEKLLFV